MGVLWAIERSRQPETWNWLWQLNATADSSGDDIDSRLPPPPVEVPRVPGELRMSSTASALNETPFAEGEGDPALTLERAWQAAWKTLHAGLSTRDRRLLYEVLRDVVPRDDAAWRTDWEAALERLDDAWSSYLVSSRAGLVDLIPAEQLAWKHVLDQLSERWSDRTQPLLAARGQFKPCDAAPLAELLTLLDDIGLQAIQDDTPWRGAEREVWFRLLERLRSQPEPTDATFTSYTQLFKQPVAYRGKLVQIRGEAVAVYSEAAPKNRYGVDQYWVYWLYPHGGSASPMLVYALEKPPGFPSFTAADVGTKKLASREEVAFTGYFFKRYAYQGQGCIYTAPTLVALAPEWIRARETLAPALPSAGLGFGTIVLLAAGAGLFAAWVYWQYRPGGRREIPEHVSFPAAEEK
jgi:hypothetical protein